MGEVVNGVWKSTYSGEQIDDLLKTKRNWIRNGYFVGTGTAGDFPINHLGQTSYSTAGLTIDGWTLTDSSQTLTINATDGGIKLSHSSNNYGIQQIIANGEKLAGKDITISFIYVSNFYVDFSSVSIYVNNAHYAQLATGSHVGYGEPAKIGEDHLVVPIPANTTQLAVGIDYGQLLAVKIEEGTASTISEDVPDYGEELARCTEGGFVPNVGKGINLFDNWYFLGDGSAGKFPVNQQGILSGYSATAPAEYGIDRWKISFGSMTPSANGLVITQSNNGYGLLQLVDPAVFDNLVGKEVTVSFLLSALSGTAVLFLGEGQIGSTTETGLFSKTITVPSGLIDLRKYFAIRANATVVAAKLELGNQQTLARQVNGSWVLNDPAPNYAEELAKCQRYQVVINPNTGSFTMAIGNVQTTNAAYLFIPTPVTLRATPTAISVLSGSMTFKKFIGTAASGTVGTITPIASTANGVACSAACSGISDDGLIAFTGGAKLLIDANL